MHRAVAGLPVAVSVALLLLASACSGSHTDKAGASHRPEPLVLTLAAHDGDAAYGTFARAVDRLSDGSIRIEVATNYGVTGDRSEVDYERGIVHAVRTGKVQLGIVGVRVWDTLGLTSFQALVAPFLIDSLSLERQALQTGLASQALASVRRARVIGIALMPGRLKRPLGITRTLVRAQDFQGATIAMRPGLVARATFHALGASGRGAVFPGDLSGFDGAELDPRTITENDYDRAARALTENVVLWPKAQTIVMNGNAFDRLTPQQRQFLRRAGRDALAPELARITRDQQVGLSALCRGTLAIAVATPSDLAGLRRAVRPVYARLERNSFTRQWIAAIRRARQATHARTTTVRCPGRAGKEKGR